MRFSIAAIAACAVSVQAFKDTSPFVLFSSSPLQSSLQGQQEKQLRPAYEVLYNAKQILGQCSDDLYILVQQDGISASELSANAPHLRNALQTLPIEGKYIVSEASGLTNIVSRLHEHLITECKAAPATKGSTTKQALQQKLAGQKKDGDAPIVIEWEYTSLSGRQSGREGAIANNDAHFFNSFIKDLPEGTKYTIIFGTTPSTVVAEDVLVYEPKFEELAHMDLRRSLGPRENKYKTSKDTRPLFEKYQFFTPGLFMGLLVSVILLSILGVGMSALSSLEVSYGAFDKEMGPAAQKKQG
ncbi:BIG/ATPase V1 complex, subunit S1 [Amylocarpus encephaloides]|uniref:Protein BIG1 n=1 Tax=Amylocarpus encephaloides TaxID=45428 RepID=A0A9P7Y945_9HELO|nr:BIG/ATPase V1 complex, subunit S1 [Amylocarpus encephaloides]